MLITAEDFAGRTGFRSVRENGAVLDQRLMCKIMTGDEDSGSREDTEGNDWAEFGVEVSESKLNFG